MKATLSLILLFIAFSQNVSGQDISGIYRWDLDSGRRNFVIELSPKNINLGKPLTSYQGEHCGVFEHGRRMDCSNGESSISLQQESENVFTGTIISAYSRTISEIKITYIPNTGNIRWEVTKHGGGTTYFPRKVIMEKD